MIIAPIYFWALGRGGAVVISMGIPDFGAGKGIFPAGNRKKRSKGSRIPKV